MTYNRLHMRQLHMAGDTFYFQYLIFAEFYNTYKCEKYIEY